MIPQDGWELSMKFGTLLFGIFILAAQSAPANTPAYAACGTYDSYILLYKSVQKFEELGKLHCGESVEITGRDGEYSQVRTTDGRFGWVATSDLSAAAPPPQQNLTFGWTEKPKPESKPNQPDVQPAAQPDAAPAVARVSESAPLLTNVNIMKMEGAHSSPDAIIAKINTSRCDFDTSPAALHRLKLSGISDRIILTMMHAPAAFSALPSDAAQSNQVMIPNQTSVQIALSGAVSSDDLQEGTIVEMFVMEDVALNGVVVFPRGAEARARIMAVKHSGLVGSNQVVWFMQDITDVSGDRIPANFALRQDGAKTAVGNFTGYPFFLTDFRKGEPAIAASSDRYTALVDGNNAMHIARPANTDQSAAKLQAQPQPTPLDAPVANTSAGFPTVVQTPDPQPAIKP
jgi:hypothetical protein